MNLFEKSSFAVLMSGMVVSGLILTGCSYLKNKNPQTVSRQDKDSAATIDRQEASGNASPTEAAMEKDSLSRDHILKF